MEYAFEMQCEDGGIEHEEITAESDSEAAKAAQEALESWIADGEWGDAGAIVSGLWTLYDSDGEEIDSGNVEVEIEPNHAALIRAAGGDTKCKHRWAAEGEGGLVENPGVWATGGTTLVICDHCEHCGLRRRRELTGSQRNPGECDTVSYSLPADEDDDDN